jgi:hypothetical protein
MPTSRWAKPSPLGGFVMGSAAGFAELDRFSGRRPQTMISHRGTGGGVLTSLQVLNR